jgi:Tfp pilus assembly PilM family ATPase
MFGEYVAGLSYSGGTLRTVVLKLKKHGPVLCYLGEEKVSDLSGVWFLRPVTEPRLRLLKKVRAVSVGIDNSSVFYHSFPFDQSAAAGREEQTDWELSNYIGGYLPEEFIKEIRTLSSDPSRDTQELLVVAANRAFIRRIQSSLQEQDLRLQVIETNFFGASYALSANYPETEMQRILLATVEGDRADAGIFHRGKLERHLCCSVESAGDVISLLGRTMEGREVHDIFMGGGGASHAMALSARQQLGRNVGLINPARRLKLKGRLRRNNEFAGVEYRFASVIGCALRKQ